MPHSPGFAGRRTAVLLATTLFLAWCSIAWPARTPRQQAGGFSPERLRRIGEFAARRIAARSFSGAVTLVAHHGRIVHLEAHGLADIESKRPMRTDAIFRIMSMTKPVVAVSILMLVEEGKVRLGDPVSRYIPALKGLQVTARPDGGAASGGAAQPSRSELVAARREITIRDLLTHTSGLVRAVPFGAPDTLERYVDLLASMSLDFQPGTRWTYSPQAGFDVLARVVEVAAGQYFDAFTQERIFRPLGMNDTFFDPARDGSRTATSYRSTPDGLVPLANPGFMNGVHFSGAGGLMSTAEDYLQFAQVLANGGEWKGVRLLSPRSVELLRSELVPSTTPGLGDGVGYGLGVRVLVDPGARNSLLSQGSFGWSGAFGTHFWVDPKEGIVGILMAQHQAPVRFLSEIEHEFETAVMQAFTPASGAAMAPEVAKAASLQALVDAELPRIQGRAGLWVKHLKTGEEAVYRADDTFNSASVIKIPVAVLAMQMAERGQLRLDQRVTITTADLREGSGMFRHHDPGLQPTFRDVLMQMIATSDNTATDLAIRAVGGVDRVNAFIAEAGYAPGMRLAQTTGELDAKYARVGRGAERIARTNTDRSLWLGTATPRAMGRMLEAIEQRTLVSQAAGDDLVRMLLAQQGGARRLPHYVGLRIGHKTGDIAPVVANDVGIAYHPTGPIVVSFFVNEITGSYGEAEDQMGRTMLRIADYFEARRK